MLADVRAHIQGGLLTALAVLLVLFGAYTAGSRAARRAEELKAERARTTSTRKAHEIKQTIDAVDTDTVRRRARSWVRKPGQ